MMNYESRKAFAIKQARFCNDLTKRLIEDLENNSNAEEDHTTYCIKNYTQMRNDIIRIRRELNKLSKMLSEN